MKVLDPGHLYELQGNKNTAATVLKFFKDAEINGDGYGGTTIQEVLRALIERVIFLDKQVPGGGAAAFVNEWRREIIELEVRAAGRHGLCMFAERRRLESAGLTVDSYIPRTDDSHIYDKDSHLASECGGRCS